MIYDDLLALTYIGIVIVAVALAGSKNIGASYIVLGLMLLIGYALGIPYFGIGLVIILIMVSSALIGFEWFLNDRSPVTA